MRQTDAELLSQYAGRRSEEAFAELARRHAGKVYSAALRMLGDGHLAEDVSQAVFLALAQKASQLGGRPSLAGWLLECTRLAATCARRERARRSRREDAVVKEPESMDAVEREAAWREVVPVLDSALSRLPNQDREAIALCYFDGLSQSEAARELGLKESALSMRVKRGLEKLRSMLGPQASALSATALGALLASNAAGAVPSGLAASLQAVGLGQAAASPAVLSLTKGAMKAMFWMKIKLAAAVVGAVVAVGGGGAVSVKFAAAEQVTPPAIQPAVAPDTSAYAAILDENSLWRMSVVCGPFFVRTAEGKLVRKKPVRWISNTGHWSRLKDVDVPVSGPLPAADWANLDFNDSGWRRHTLPFPACKYDTQYTTGLVFLRSRFEVRDPAQVADLRLSVTYYGGLVVLVNGKEVTRGSLPAGASGLDAPAEDYPAETVTTPDGKLLHPFDNKNKDRLALRERKLSDVKIPSELLRKGTNVLAIEVHAAPVPAVVFKHDVCGDDCWPPVGLLAAKLAAPPQAAIAANLARPGGVQVWNCQPWETVDVFRYGDPLEPLRPIAVFGARNGVFSGRLMVSSDQTLKGLKASVTELRGENGDMIPAAAVRLRCAALTMPADSPIGNDPNLGVLLRRGRFDGLLDVIPSEVAVSKVAPPPGKKCAPGALAPLWVTVRVPKDAKPGRYEGTVTVAAEGLPATKVPLKLTVYDWVLPDPLDFRTSVCGYSLPETLAKYYNVPLWSDQHWALVGKSLALMSELNSRQVLVNLAVDWYGLSGNEQSEVRWIRQPDGSLKHDFSILDKHLDIVAKSMGKPRPLRLNCWVATDKPFDKIWPDHPKGWEDPWLLTKMAGYVTTLDPASGKLDRMTPPCPGTPESLAFWKPVLDEIRKKLEARGWFDVTCVGHSDYVGGILPTVVDNYRKIWPDGAFAVTAHGAVRGGPLVGTDKTPMPVVNVESVWTIPNPEIRGYRKLLDPKVEKSRWYKARHGLMNSWNLESYRRYQEATIMCALDGNQLGADVFPIKGESKKYYFEADCRGGLGPSADGTLSILAPGADGPIASERYEMYREGLQLAEAIIFLQRALDEKKIHGDLERRVNECLDARGEDLMRTVWGNGVILNWAEYGAIAERDERILALAAEATRAGAK